MSWSFLTILWGGSLGSSAAGLLGLTGGAPVIRQLDWGWRVQGSLPHTPSSGLAVSGGAVVPFHMDIWSSRGLAQASPLFVVLKFQTSESKGRESRVKAWFQSWRTTTSTSFCQSKSQCHPDSSGWRHRFLEGANQHTAKGRGPREDTH